MTTRKFRRSRITIADQKRWANDSIKASQSHRNELAAKDEMFTAIASYCMCIAESARVSILEETENIKSSKDWLIKLNKRGKTK